MKVLVSEFPKVTGKSQTCVLQPMLNRINPFISQLIKFRKLCQNNRQQERVCQKMPTLN
jgi:hypothetical protein